MKTPFEDLFCESGERQKLSDNTIKHYHRFLSSLFSSAVKWHYMTYNPAQRVEAPTGEAKEAVSLSLNESFDLLRLIQNEPICYRTAIELLLSSGMRRGELVGLHWNDIDFFNNTVSIKRSRLYIPGKGVMDSKTKTQKSKRDIDIPAVTMRTLFQYQQWQKDLFSSLGRKLTGEDQVFVTQQGTPMNPDTLTNWFHEFIASTDLPQIHIHSLRHTYATLLIDQGIPITVTANQLGHKKVSTTIDIYAHALKSGKKEAAKAMDNLLSQARQA